MAADPFEAADTLVDEIADLESDEDLLHLSTDDDGDSEEAVCRIFSWNFLF